MVDTPARALVSAVIDAYNTTRFADVDPVSHVLSKPSVLRALTAHADDAANRPRSAETDTLQSRAYALLNRVLPSISWGPDSRCEAKSQWSNHDVERVACAALAEARRQMTEDEILRRARRALAATLEDDTRGNESVIRKVASGGSDDSPGVRSIVRALRDLDKPLEPTLDQRLTEIADRWLQESQPLNVALKAAYEMGKSDAH